MDEELEKLISSIEEDEENGEQNSLAGQLLEVLFNESSQIYLFHDQDDNAYAAIERNDRNEIHRVRGKSFAEYISFVAWDRFKKSVPKSTKETIVATVEARAKFNGEKYELYLKTAWHDDALWYDLGDWRAVKITGKGWEVIDKPPILFKRFSHQQAQIEPESGGNLRDILRFINLSKDSYEQSLLFLTYLVAVLIPDIPRPILVAHGLQGSAKSTFFRIVKNLIDPSQLDLLSCPRDVSELIQMISHHYLVCFDNLSVLTEWQSDALCRACTGQSFSKRQLYTDDDDIFYRYKRAIAINGINLVATKPDLLDRSLIFELPVILDNQRVDEKDFLDKFVGVKARILGSIFTAMSNAIRLTDENKIVLQQKPRLADYAKWCSAIAISIGATAEEFMDAYAQNVERQNIEAIEASAVAQTIVDFMKDREEVRGSAKDIFDILKEHAESLGLNKDTDFPRSQRWVWRKIKIVKVNLLNMKIEAVYDDSKRPREIILRKIKAQENDGNDGYNDNELSEMTI